MRYEIPWYMDFFRKIRIGWYKIHWSAEFLRKIRIVSNFSYRTKRILSRKINGTAAKSALIKTALGEYSLYLIFPHQSYKKWPLVKSRQMENNEVVQKCGPKFLAEFKFSRDFAILPCLP